MLATWLASAPGVRVVSTSHLAGGCFWGFQVAALILLLARGLGGSREQLRSPVAATRHACGGGWSGLENTSLAIHCYRYRSYSRITNEGREHIWLLKDSLLSLVCCECFPLKGFSIGIVGFGARRHDAKRHGLSCCSATRLDSLLGLWIISTPFRRYKVPSWIYFFTPE